MTITIIIVALIWYASLQFLYNVIMEDVARALDRLMIRIEELEKVNRLRND